jgi:hypothetical protein
MQNVTIHLDRFRVLATQVTQGMVLPAKVSALSKKGEQSCGKEIVYRYFNQSCAKQ